MERISPDTPEDVLENEKLNPLDGLKVEASPNPDDKPPETPSQEELLNSMAPNMEKVEESLKEDLEAKSRVNDALMDKPVVIKADRETYELKGFTLDRLWDIDSTLSDYFELVDAYNDILAEVQAGKRKADRTTYKELRDKSKEKMEALSLVLSKILQREPEWVRKNVDVIRWGPVIVEEYRKKCSLDPMIEGLSLARMF